MALPMALLLQALQKNSAMSDQRQSGLGDNNADILQGRQDRIMAQNQIQPMGRVGANGMTLDGDGMARQEQVYNDILSKWGGARTGGY